MSRDRILKAALEIADGEGLTALSMRTLAGKLGVKAMSLYNHVRNKDDIVEGLTDMVVGEIEVPKIREDWKESMRRRATSAHHVLLKHPWATMVLVSRQKAGPETLRYVNATIGCLTEAGFSYELADHAWNTMDSHIYGFTLQELNFPFEASDYSHTAEEFLPQVPKGEYPYFINLARKIADGSYSGVHDFEFGLKLILDGLERCLHE